MEAFFIKMIQQLLSAIISSTDLNNLNNSKKILKFTNNYKLMEAENQIEIFQANDGSTQIYVQFQHDIVWLTQAKIAELFETTPQNITKHFKSILKEEELYENTTFKDFLHVRKEGTRTLKRK